MVRTRCFLIDITSSTQKQCKNRCDHGSSSTHEGCCPKLKDLTGKKAGGVFWPCLKLLFLASPQNHSLDPQPPPPEVPCCQHLPPGRYLLQLPQAGCEAARVWPVQGALEVGGGLAGRRLHGPEGHDPGEGVCRGRNGPGHGHPSGARPKTEPPRPPARPAPEGRAGAEEAGLMDRRTASS